jgi:hypothetical protein
MKRLLIGLLVIARLTGLALTPLQWPRGATDHPLTVGEQVTCRSWR